MTFDVLEYLEDDIVSVKSNRDVVGFQGDGIPEDIAITLNVLLIVVVFLELQCRESELELIDHRQNGIMFGRGDPNMGMVRYLFTGSANLADTLFQIRGRDLDRLEDSGVLVLDELEDMLAIHPKMADDCTFLTFFSMGHAIEATLNNDATKHLERVVVSDVDERSNDLHQPTRIMLERMVAYFRDLEVTHAVHTSNIELVNIVALHHLNDLPLAFRSRPTPLIRNIQDGQAEIFHAFERQHADILIIQLFTGCIGEWLVVSSLLVVVAWSSFKDTQLDTVALAKGHHQLHPDRDDQVVWMLGVLVRVKDVTSDKDDVQILEPGLGRKPIHVLHERFVDMLRVVLVIQEVDVGDRQVRDVLLDAELINQSSYHP